MRRASTKSDLYARLFAAALLMAVPARAHAAGGGYAVDNAAIGEPGTCQVESWMSSANNRDFFAASAPACVVELGRPIELTVQGARSRAFGLWTTAVTPRFKTIILPLEQNRLAIGISGGAIFDVATGLNSADFINVPATWKPTEQISINLNGGWFWDRVDAINFLTWGAGFEWTFVERFTLIGEVFGRAGRNAVPRSVTEPRTQWGLRYTPIEAVDVDFIYGRNVGGERADWITVGVNARFGGK